jgi:hypothetical protein
VRDDATADEHLILNDRMAQKIRCWYRQHVFDEVHIASNPVRPYIADLDKVADSLEPLSEVLREIGEAGCP